MNQNSKKVHPIDFMKNNQYRAIGTTCGSCGHSTDPALTRFFICRHPDVYKTFKVSGGMTCDRWVDGVPF